MPSSSNISVDELIALVAGTLSDADFVRVATAVKSDAALQAQLAGFENIRSELIKTMAFDKRQATAEVFAEDLVKRVERSGTALAKSKGNNRTSWLSRLFAQSPTPARFAYALVAIQAVGMTWLVSGGLQTDSRSASTTRSIGADSKQLGSVPGNVTFSVSFDPATPESTVRGLLLEVEAQIIAGPSQLGQYRIVVARNRSHLALLKLREAVFVEQVTEITGQADKPVVPNGEVK